MKTLRTLFAAVLVCVCASAVQAGGPFYIYDGYQEYLFAKTGTEYWGTDDWDVAVKNELGPQWNVAEWGTLGTLFGGSIATPTDLADLIRSSSYAGSDSGRAWVTYGGAQEVVEQAGQYYSAVSNYGATPSYMAPQLVAQLGGNMVDLVGADSPQGILAYTNDVFTTPQTVNVSMNYYGKVDDTVVYYGVLMSDVPGKVVSVTLTDANLQGSASGVFSGFDLDFIFANQTGDFTDGADTVIDPTSVVLNPGTVREAESPHWTPTLLHPGDLFGQRLDGNLDITTATINKLDGSFEFGLGEDGYPLLSTNTSNGWVALGDGGSFTGDFMAPLTLGRDQGGSPTFIFVGDVGTNDEFIDATLSVEFLPGQIYQPPVHPGGPYTLAAGQQRLMLDSTQSTVRGFTQWSIAAAGAGGLKLMPLPSSADPTLNVSAQAIRQFLWYATGAFDGPAYVHVDIDNFDNEDPNQDFGEGLTTLSVAPEVGQTADLSIYSSASAGGPYYLTTGDIIQLNGASTNPDAAYFTWLLAPTGELPASAKDTFWFFEGPNASVEYEELFWDYGPGVDFDLTMFVFDTNLNLIGIDETTLHTNPEPTTLALIGVGGLALLKRRRKS